MKTPIRHLALALTATLISTATIAQVDDDNSIIDYQWAETCFADGYYREASRALDNELRQYPTNASAYLLYAEVSQRLSRFDLSGRHYATAIMLSEPHPELETYTNAVIGYASLLNSKANDPDAAEALINQAVKNAHPVNLYLWQGHYAQQRGNYAKAHKSYRAALKANKKKRSLPDDEIYGNYIIPALLLDGKLAEAEKAIAEAQSKCPDGTKWKRAKVSLLDIQGQDEAAIDLCLEAGFLIPQGAKDAPAVSDYDGLEWSLKLMDLANKNYDLVMAKLDRFVRRIDASDAALYEATDIAYRLQHHQDFLRFYAMYAPGRFGSSFHVANAYFNIFANDMAEVEINGAIKANTNASADFIRGLHTLKAQILARQGNIDGAVAILDSIADHHTLAHILTTYTRRYAEAAAHADTALALVPRKSADGLDLLCLRMMCHKRLGNEDQARADASHIIAYEAENLQSRDTVPDVSHLHQKSAHQTCGYSRFAYAILWQTAKAISAINQCLAPCVDLNRVPLYQKFIEAAQAYSLLGMTDLTFNYLAKALETGYRDFLFIDSSPCFDAIRNRDDFAELIDSYRLKHSQETDALKNN